MSTDPIMSEILDAVGVLQSGDRSGARIRLEGIWSRIAQDAQPIHECTLSHYMADVQDEAKQELAWDLRALDAALRCTDVDAQRHSQAPDIAAFMPSLHASLAEDYLALGDIARSKMHLEAAQRFADHLNNDAYGQTVRSGIDRIAGRLGDLA